MVNLDPIITNCFEVDALDKAVPRYDLGRGEYCVIAPNGSVGKVDVEDGAITLPMCSTRLHDPGKTTRQFLVEVLLEKTRKPVSLDKIEDLKNVICSPDMFDILQSRVSTIMVQGLEEGTFATIESDAGLWSYKEKADKITEFGAYINPRKLAVWFIR